MELPAAILPDSILPDARLQGADENAAQASVKGAAMWAAGGQYIAFVLQFATSVIISRFFLAPAEIGLFSVALATALLLSILQDFGISRYVTGHADADAATIRTCSVFAIIFSAAIALLLLALSRPVASFYAEPRLAPILMLIAASYVFTPWSIVPVALLSRALNFRATFAVNVSGALANSVVAIALSAAGFSAESLAWAMIAQAAVRAIIARWLQPSPFPWPPRLAGAREVLAFGSASSVLYLSGAIGVRSPDLVIGRALGMGAVGLFSRGSALAAQFHMLVIGAVGSVYFPAFARLRNEGKPFGPYYERIVALHGAVVWPAMALLAAMAEPVVRLLYGPAWTGAAPILAWLAIAEITFVTLPAHVDLPILLGRIRTLIAINLVDTLLSIGTLTVATFWGVEASAQSRLIYGLAWFCLYAGWMHRLIGFNWRTMIDTYGRSALLASATAAPAIWATHGWRTAATLNFPAMVATALLAGLCWTMAIFLLRHPAKDDLIAMVRHVIAALAWLPGRSRAAT